MSLRFTHWWNAYRGLCSTTMSNIWPFINIHVSTRNFCLHLFKFYFVGKVFLLDALFLEVLLCIFTCMKGGQKLKSFVSSLALYIFQMCKKKINIRHLHTQVCLLRHFQMCSKMENHGNTYINMEHIVDLKHKGTFTTYVQQ